MPIATREKSVDNYKKIVSSSDEFSVKQSPEQISEDKKIESQIRRLENRINFHNFNMESINDSTYELNGKKSFVYARPHENEEYIRFFGLKESHKKIDSLLNDIEVFKKYKNKKQETMVQQRFIESVHCIYSAISYITFSNRNKKTEISSQLFRSCKDKYVNVIKFLMDYEFINRLNHYHTDDITKTFYNKCCRFKLKPSIYKKMFSNHNENFYSIKADKTLLSRVYTWHSDFTDVNLNKVSDIKVKNAEKLKNNVINKQESEIKDAEKTLKKENNPNYEQDKNRVDRVIQLIKLKYANELNEIERIESGYLYSKIDSFGRRLHTNFTNLSKETRSQLYNTKTGKGFAQIDVISSQMCFLESLIRNTEYAQYPNQLAKDVKNGTVYETIVDAMNAIVEDKQYTRNEVKLICLKNIMGNSAYIESQIKNDIENRFEYTEDQGYFQSYCYDNDEKTLDVLKDSMKDNYIWIEAMKKVNPEVYEFLMGFKQTNGYKAISRQLQRMESNWLLNHCIPKIKKFLPEDAPFFTVHDCVFVEEDYIEGIKKIMIDTLRECDCKANVKVSLPTI